MFADLMSSKIQPALIPEQIGAEINISDGLQRGLEKMFTEEENDHHVNISSTTSVVQVDKNYVFMSNRWFYLAVLCKDYAEALYPYCLFFNEKIKNNREIIEALAAEKYDADCINGIFDNDDDKAKMLSFIKGDSDFRPGKALLNGNKIRSVKDIFGSCLLKKLAVPDASSAYLGNIIYYLVQRPSIYNELKDELLDKANSVNFDVNIYGIHITKKNDALSDDNPHICIGWSVLGDLRGISTYDELETLYDNVYKNDNNRSKGQDLGQIWRFIHEINIGDIIVYSKDGECHIGRVESDYYYEEIQRDSQDNDYVNNRKVVWLKKHIPLDSLAKDFANSLKAAMSLWSLDKHKDKIIDILSSKSTAPEIGFAHNRILFGAPGTGKSHQLKKDMEIPFADEECFERVTFHPAYSYAHFFGCYKPVSEGNDIRYEFVPGPFARIWAKAMNNPGENYLLLIEEINRAEVAAVFGDMFQLLDRTNGESTYSVAMSEDFKKYLAKEYPGIVSDKMKLPRNMYIWATMNSADQGVYPMDTAFKRRWNFEYTSLDAAKDALYDKKFILNCPKANENDRVQSFTWNELRESLNTWLSDKNVNEDKLMGPFFLSADIVGKAEIEARIKAAVDTVDAADTDAVKKAVETVLKDISSRFSAAFKNKVLMYLFDDAAKPKRPLLFSNAGQQNRYSKICEEFDAKGLKIFSPEISEHGKILYDREAARASEEEIDAILSQYGPGYVPEQSVVADPNQDTDVGNEA